MWPLNPTARGSALITPQGRGLSPIDAAASEVAQASLSPLSSTVSPTHSIAQASGRSVHFTGVPPQSRGGRSSLSPSALPDPAQTSFEIEAAKKIREIEIAGQDVIQTILLLKGKSNEIFREQDRGQLIRWHGSLVRCRENGSLIHKINALKSEITQGLIIASSIQRDQPINADLAECETRIDAMEVYKQAIVRHLLWFPELELITKATLQGNVLMLNRYQKAIDYCLENQCFERDIDELIGAVRSRLDILRMISIQTL